MLKSWYFIAREYEVCLQEKLMSIVGKKRVKPEVVLLLPRSYYNSTYFWLWILTQSLNMEEITLIIYSLVELTLISAYWCKSSFTLNKFDPQFILLFIYHLFCTFTSSVFQGQAGWKWRTAGADENHSNHHEAVDHDREIDDGGHDDMMITRTQLYRRAGILW